MATKESLKLDLDDPILAIRVMLAMADDLYNKSDPQSQNQDGRQTITKNTTGEGMSQPKADQLKKINTVPSNEQDDPKYYMLKLRRNLRMLKVDVAKLLDHLQVTRSEVAYEVGKHATPLEKLLSKVDREQSGAVTKGMKKDLEDINNKISDVMFQVPTFPYKRRYRGGLNSEAAYLSAAAKFVLLQPNSDIESSKQPALLHPNSFLGDPVLAINTIIETMHNLHNKLTMRTNTVSIPLIDEENIKFSIRKLKSNLFQLESNLRQLKNEVVKLQNVRQDVGRQVTEEVKKQITPLEKLLLKVDKGESGVVWTKDMKKDLEDINRKMFNLMFQVPVLSHKSKYQRRLGSEAGEVDNNGEDIECLPAIHANEEYLKRLPVFRQVCDQFKELEIDSRICLLSFAVFPENQEVNRTMLMYWWISEGLLHVSGNGKPPKNGSRPKEEKPEKVVKAILDDFTRRKLIEPVQNKRKVEPDSYKMSPFVHSSVVLISKEIGLFDMYHNGKKPSMNLSKLNKICLVKGSSRQLEAIASKIKDIEKMETVFNVSERFPDFTFKWFAEAQPSRNKTLARLSKTTYKNLKVFYLGRWERTSKRHIEVKNPELMNSLKHMTKLKLLSFQGISGIERLDDAVCKLGDLVILDLRACYHLGKLPEKIDSLKKLVYLDITDCYFIDRMPKRLSWLDNLEVLKGFVVSDAKAEENVCLLAELKHLRKLRKLSITIKKGDLTVEKLFSDVQGFKNLEKLKMAWFLDINKLKKNKQEKESNAPSLSEKAPKDQKQKPLGLPEKLKKLELQRFPDAELPSWIQPHRLGVLEKLYIKGGTELTGFGVLPDGEPTRCNVKILRLKILPRLKVEWRDLKERYFPKLEFLEKYQCPQVSLCPTDGIGIWRKECRV